jgi:hypothetical protein
MLLRENKTVVYLLLSLLALFSIMAGPAAAQDESGSGISLSASAGFDGFYKSEYGIPVQILVSNSGAAIEGDLQVVTSAASPSDRIVYNAPISLPTQSAKRLTLYVHVPSFPSALDVELLDASGRSVAGTTTNPLRQVSRDELLYGVLSPDPGELTLLEDISGTRSRASAAFLEITDMPEVTAAWNALDVLIVNDVDTGELSANQSAALRGWVSTGGQLVVTGGPGWQKTVANVSEMLPVTITGSESIHDLPALRDRLGIPFRDPGPYLITMSNLRNGELIYHQDGLPILAKRNWGLGTVYFLALDPKLAPLLDWDGSEQLWSEIASFVPVLPAWGQGVQNSYAASTAITSLPSLALPSVFQLSLFLLVYVFVVGPANYLVLKRLKRRELAWFTIPALVLVFSGAAYVTGFQLKGNEIIINQMSIAYGRAGGEHVRVQTLIGLYSPRRSTYDLVFSGDTMARPFEGNFGGIGGSGNIKAITRQDDLTLTGVRVDVSDTQTFIVDSYQEAPSIEGQASLSLNGSDILLDVTVHNGGDLALQNVSVLLGTEVITLGSLGPGESESATEFLFATSSTSGIPSLSSAAPVYVPGPGSASPLTYHADDILGTSDYYNDPEAFPRWQLLQAIEGDAFSSRAAGSATKAFPSDVVTIIAWSSEPLIEVSLDQVENAEHNTVVYFLEIPLTQQIVAGDNVSIPISLMSWEVIGNGSNYEPSIMNLYLEGGWVEFEYMPWSEFQTMSVTGMAIALESLDPAQSQMAPEIRLWDWQEGIWITTEEGWGTTTVEDPHRFIGPGLAVRIRLQDRDSFGTTIREVYPIISGNLQ